MDGLLDTDFVVFDVETTGLSPKYGDRIVEIAALKVCNQKIVDRFETLLDPQRMMPFGAFQVHGISDEILKGAPSAEKILPDFLEFIGDTVLVGHNIKFDMRFLNNELMLCGFPMLKKQWTIDTIKMARRIIPELGRYSLGVVAQFLEVDDSMQHRAMSDVVMTYKIFLELIRLAGKKKTHSFKHIREFILA